MNRERSSGSPDRTRVRPLVKRRAQEGDAAFRAYGIGVSIRTECLEVLERLAAYLPPGWEPVRPSRIHRFYAISRGASSNGSAYVLHVNARPMLEGDDLGELLANLALDLRLYIAEHARGRIFVHAGVVGWRGRAIVLPGRSSSGKTTLVRALVRCGAIYYSDEYAVFDRRGYVHPFPTLLFLRREDALSAHLPIEALGGSVGTTPLPVGLIAITAYGPTRQQRWRRLSPGEALLELLAHTVPARRRPASVLAALSRVVSHASALKGKRGEAEPTAQMILDRYASWSES
mgnify:CR=1 FL=1|jgi:hypothetical protein